MSEIRDKLSAARDRGLTETNAQGVFLSLKELRTSDSEHRGRWIWELLQNAADAAIPGSGGNHIEIEVTDRSLIFRHKGSAFSADQIFHLIYHGSTKQEFETDKIRFGTGFLTIHLISEGVRVSGVLAETEKGLPFAFQLCRSGANAKEIQARMEEAWVEFNDSVECTEGDRSFSTAFECVLEGEAKELVQTGLLQLKSAAPYVLALVPEIQRISVIETGGTATWTTTLRQKDHECLNIDVHQKVGANEEASRIAIVGDHIKSIGIAVRLAKEGDVWRVCDESHVPRLYYPLPLVATTDLPFPFIVASACFEAQEKRDGIYAGKPSAADTVTAHNWELLSRVPALYRSLLQEGARNSWIDLHRLLAMGPLILKDWLDEGLLREKILKPVIDFVQSIDAPAVIPAANSGRLRAKEVIVPDRKSAPRLLPLLQEIVTCQARLPSESAIESCTRMIEGWAAVNLCEPNVFDQYWDIRRVAGFAAGCDSTAKLREELSSRVDLYEWLNAAYFAAGTDLATKVQELAWLPNQRGMFRFERDLQLDGNFGEELKDIAETLGEDLRVGLLDDRVNDAVKALFGEKKGRTFTVDDAVARCKKAVSGANRAETSISAAGRLIDWLIRTKRSDKIVGIPAICIEGSRQLSQGSELLAPAPVWTESARQFGNLWADERRLHDGYAGAVSADSWKALESADLVRLDLLTSEMASSVTQALTDEDLGENDHNLSGPFEITRIYGFSGSPGIRERASKSRKSSLQLLKFVLKHVIFRDPAWDKPLLVPCKCGKSHALIPGWLEALRGTAWVHCGRSLPPETPSAKNLAAILDEEARQLLLTDDKCAAFLLKLGFGVSDIIRNGLPDDQKLRLERIAAGVYANTDPAVAQGITALLANPTLANTVLGKQAESERVRRNQAVGAMVENVIRGALEAVGALVTRTGVGSDYEVSSDYIENGQQQLLDIEQRKFLVEIKSTTENFVRMTLTQGRTACEASNRLGYTLCVVPFIPSDADLTWVRNHVRFVVGMHRFVEMPVEDAAKLKAEETAAIEKRGDQVELDVDKSIIKLRVNSTVWEKDGIGFDEFIAVVTGSPSG